LKNTWIVLCQEVTLIWPPFQFQSLLFNTWWLKFNTEEKLPTILIESFSLHMDKNTLKKEFSLKNIHLLKSLLKKLVEANLDSSIRFLIILLMKSANIESSLPKSHLLIILKYLGCTLMQIWHSDSKNLWKWSILWLKLDLKKVIQEEDKLEKKWYFYFFISKGSR